MDLISHGLLDIELAGKVIRKLIVFFTCSRASTEVVLGLHCIGGACLILVGGRKLGYEVDFGPDVDPSSWCVSPENHLADHRAGIAALATLLSGAIQRQDDLADGKIARAMSILEDGRMLKFTELDGDTAAFTWFESVLEETLRESLLDSMVLIKECTAMWSPERASQQLTALCSWADAVAQKLASLDDVLWAMMDGLLRRGSNHGLLF